MTYLFINLHRNFYDKHGVYAMSAVLKAQGHKVVYCECDHKTVAESAGYDVRMYSMFSPQVESYIRFEQGLKDGRPSIAGGFGVTFARGSLPFTRICRGEGEKQFGMYGGLDDLPFPDRAEVYRANGLLRLFPAKQFLSGRGCPFACTYCFNHAYRGMFTGEYVRRKTVGYMMEEIDRVRRAYPLQKVVFQDDTFILSLVWLEEWARKWNNRAPYTCNVRANLVTDEVCRMLKVSGCVGVNWSFESGSERIRNDIMKRNMTDSQIYECAFLLRKNKIPFRVASMIGLPTETAKDREDTFLVAKRLKADYSLCNTFVPYAGLDITTFAITQGVYNGAKVPATFYQKSCLNFTDDEKHDMLKTCLLWSGLVRGRWWLRLLPLFLCKLYWKMADVYNMFCLYVFPKRVIKE